MPRPTNTFVAGNDILADEQNENWTEVWDAVEEIERARQKEFTADESISAGNAVKLIPTQSAVSIGTDLTEYPLNSSSVQKIANIFSSASDAYINRAIAYLKRTGNCGNVTCEIREGSASGTLIATATIAQASVGTSAGNINFDFTNIVKLAGGTTYYIVLFGTTYDVSNYLSIYKNATGGGSGSNFATYNGSWNYSLYAGTNASCALSYTAGRIMKAKAITSGEADLFIGFAQDAINSSASGIVTLHGLVTTSGLTAVRTYYLSDTAGAIALTAGTVSKKVGKSLSTTELFAIMQL